MDNGCPVCGGSGRVLAFGLAGEGCVIRCPECAGLRITPASAEDRHAAEPAPDSASSAHDETAEPVPDVESWDADPVPDNPPPWTDLEPAV